MGNEIVLARRAILFYINITLILFASYGTEAFIGINWGRHTSQRLLPSQVVDLILQNGIQNARLFSSEEDILKAFVDSGINLTVAIFKADLLLANMTLARTWVRLKSKYLIRSNIRQVIVGNYPINLGNSNRHSILKKAMAGMKNLQDAFNEAGYDGIATNMLHQMEGLKPNITKPSEAEFPDESKYQITLFVEHLRANNAPFLIETFPIIEAHKIINDFNFAFIDNKNSTVKDVNGAVYTNMFEFVYDSFVWALTKINASDIKVVVAQVGWPTDGYPGATTANAERFHKYLLPFVASNKGTPMRPGAPIDVYVHSLTDETKMPYNIPFTRHWGIFRSNGQPKYKIDLSGRGRDDVYPSTMDAIMRMPKRWCVFNGDKTSVSLVKSQLEYACIKGDCSSTTAGGSCSGLSFEQNVSYAFNMLFQFEFQSERSCDFRGLGRVSVKDPSTTDCVFPIEVVKGQQKNFVYRTFQQQFNDVANGIFNY